MILRDARRLLGVGHDADARAIRRAYADALRAIDPDADPEGFAKLREARDIALAAARAVAGAVSATIDMGDHDAVSLDTEADPADGAVNLDLPPPSAIEDEHATAMGGHAAALIAILSPDHPAGYHLDAEAERAAHAHLDALLADPRLDQIEMRAWAEQWYAETSVAAGSRADPILSRLVDFFGWQRDAGSLDQSDAVVGALARYGEIGFTQALSDPRHRFHRAWRVLSGERSGLRSLYVRKKRVRELLALIRSDHPRIERYLDPSLVADWEFGKPTVLPMIILMILFYVVLMRCAALVAPDDRSPAIDGSQPIVSNGPRSTPEKELPSVLAIVGGPDLTLARVDRENPVLGQWLRTRWNSVSDDNRDLIGGDQKLQAELLRRAALEQQRTTYAIAAALVRLHLDEARSTEQFGSQACVDYWQGKPMPAAVVARFGERRQGLAARLLLAAPFDRPVPVFDGRFSIAGSSIASIATRAGMPIADVLAALHDRGPVRARCAVSRALAEVALTLPRKQGLPILRKL